MTWLLNFTVITLRLLNDTVSIDESVENPQICVNVTEGTINSSAEIQYYTSEGTASSKFIIKINSS